MRVLPGSMAREVLDGMLANDLLGFQTVRWARNFMWCCHELLDAEIDMDQGLVRYGDRETVVRHYPISIDIDSVRAVASSKDADRARRWLDRLLGGRKLIIRVDRLELSKNVVRGFRAFEAFLNRYPEWRDKVVHLALLYPSRRAIREYREYEATVLDTHDRINAELGTDEWQPIVLLNEDNYTRAIACLSRYDALVVNPIADGMNLVAKEGPAVNETDGVLILSRNAGAWYELAHAAVSVNPYDISKMAEAMHTALTLDPDQRAARARLLREVVERNNPTKWVWHQLRDIRRLHEA
jgi:trehalose 6-phosphate synthase